MSTQQCLAVIDTPKGARRCRRFSWNTRCWQHVAPNADPKRPRPLNTMSTCNLCCFWLSPDGKGYHLDDEAAGYGSHSGVAHYALGDTSGGRRLDDQGYVHVSYGSAFMGDGSKQVTQAQLDYLFDVVQELRTKRHGARGESRAEYIGHFITKEQEKVLA